MKNLLAPLITGLMCFILGSAYNLSNWYEMAQNEAFIEIGGKVYKFVEQKTGK
ncbi:hypothetical protein [Acinetobacter proteolyticus]|uniref:hypothetical protein n=1 Tax=Acinetobacter proteolyticus TaxID=1776741 RepID=UPI00148BE8FE|nr:hypothetical protein [Acinetobacter proteolyticus]MBK5646241.1 hypothetical protein [Acinetobacter sp.]